MSAGVHKVQRILLELSNSERETYPSDEKDFSLLLNGSLTRALEELLDEVDLADTTIQIPKLDLDLGTIQRPFQNDAIVSLFKEKLRAQLKQEVAKKEEEATKESRTELDTLIYFLRNGTLPWWTSSLPDTSRFSDPNFKTGFKNYFYTEATDTWIDRLAKQFTYKEIGPLLSELVIGNAENNFKTLDKLISRLSASDNFAKRKTAQSILRKFLWELISRKGNIRSFSEFITEYISEDPELKELNVSRTSEYLEDKSIETIPALLEAKKDLREENTKGVLVESKAQSDFVNKEKILLHYLSFGSLPKGDFTIIKNELDFLVTEFILKRSKKIRDLFKDHVDREEILIEILLNLPQHHFKTLLAALSPIANSISETIIKQFSQSSSTSVSSTELKALASHLILDEVLKKNEISVAELYKKSQLSLETPEKIKLKEFLAKVDPEFGEEKSSIVTPQKETSKIDAAYFSDLLDYLFEYHSWPWWGNLYSKTYREINAETSWEKAVESVVQNFDVTYPAFFIGFTRSFINANSKPSLIFSKLNWELSKKILDKALPFFKNSLSDTLEATLEIISRHEKSALEASIITQQLIFFIIDQKKEERSDFKELVNAIITTIAVKLNTPLWEIYSILIKNYKSLELKYELTKEEATTLFAYHETLEDQYVKESQAVQNTSDPILKNISEINFISGEDEILLLNHISGTDSVLKTFPSAWALGQFIVERLKNSSSLGSTLKNYLAGSDFRPIFRIVQLEKLSGQAWIKGLLEEKEDFTFQGELFFLLRNLSSTDEATFRNIIRSSLLKEKYLAGEKLSAAKLKTILKTISNESGVEFSNLELEILQNISSEKNAGISIRKAVGEQDLAAEATELENKTFVSQLKELEFKKHVLKLAVALKGLGVENKVAELFVKLHAIQYKKQFLLWIENALDFEDKKTLSGFIEKIDDTIELSSYIKSFKVTLEPVLENVLQEWLPNHNPPRYISSFIELLGKVENTRVRQQISEHIERNPYADQKTFVSLIQGIPEFAEKATFIQFVRNEFPEQNFIGEYFEISESKQKNTLQYWKEKLNFDLVLTDAIIQSSLSKNTSTEDLQRVEVNPIKVARREEVTSSDLKAEHLDYAENKTSEEKEIDLKNMYQLSAEGIADIVIYFFFNFELPWWSPVKDIATFEKLLQDLSWSSPFVLKEKILETANYHPQYFQNIGSGLIAERNEEKIRVLTGEDLESVLKEDLHYLSANILEKGDRTYFDPFITEILSKFQSISLENEEIQEAFRKIVVLLVNTIDTEVLKNLPENENTKELAEIWQQASEKVFTESKIKNRQYEQIRNYLKELEEKYNKEGLLKRISVTDNLFAITDWNVTYPIKELLNTWLHMLETYTGTITKKVKQELQSSTEIKIAGGFFVEEIEILKTSQQFNVYLKGLEEKYIKEGTSIYIKVTDHLFSLVTPTQNYTAKDFVNTWFELMKSFFGNSAEKIKEKLARLPDLKFTDEKENSKDLEKLQKQLKKFEVKYTDQSLKNNFITDNLFSLLAQKNNYSAKDLLDTWLLVLEPFTGGSTEALKAEIYDSTEIRLVAENNEAKEIPGASDDAKMGSLFLLPYTNYMNALSLILGKAENLSPVEKRTALQLTSELFLVKEMKGDPSLPIRLTFKYLENSGVSKVELRKTIFDFKESTANPELQSIFNKIYDIVSSKDAKNTYSDETGKQKENTAEIQTSLPEAVNEIVKHFQDRVPVLEKLVSFIDPVKKQELKKEIPEQTRSREMPEMDLEARIYVPNAGLIILWPFLSRLFSNLKYTDKGKFIDPEKQVRAIHLTQYLVGFTEDHPEYTLMLNKLICGMELTEPIERSVNLTEEEKTEARNLLSSVIAQWKEMNNTSVENFQRTFIQREGVIWQKDGNWNIKVEHTSFDILLLKLPWGLSMIKYPWNNYLIFVEWKAMN